MAVIQSATPASGAYLSSMQQVYAGLTAGDSIILVVGTASSIGDVCNIPTDTQGNTWRRLPSAHNDPAFVGIEAFIAQNVAAGANTITVTDSGGYMLSVMSYELSDVAAVGSPLDSVGSATGLTPTISVSSNEVTDNANDQIIMVGGISAIGTMTVGSGYSNLLQTNNTQNFGMQHKVVAATGVQSGSMASSTTGQSFAGLIIALASVSQGNYPTYSSNTIAGAGADDTGSGGTGVWSSPGSITASDNTRASTTNAGLVASHYLKASNFGFAIPAGATILGITVAIERIRSGGIIGQIRDSSIKLYKAGTLVGTDHADVDTNWPTTEALTYRGSSSDLWGTTWSASDINNSGFGVGIASAASAGTGNRVANIDAVYVSVAYVVASATGGKPQVKISGAFAKKTVKYKTGGAFAAKTMKVKVGGSFIQAV